MLVKRVFPGIQLAHVIVFFLQDFEVSFKQIEKVLKQKLFVDLPDDVFRQFIHKALVKDIVASVVFIVTPVVAKVSLNLVCKLLTDWHAFVKMSQ
jgi:hypothetical protein